MIVICVSAFLVAFALAIVYTGSMLMARANRRLEQERIYQLAGSFAQVLDGELARYSGIEDLTDSASMASQPGYDNSFYRFACRFLENPTYAEYNPDYPDLTTFYYRPETNMADSRYGTVTIILYKENDQETDVMEGILQLDSSSGGESGDKADPVQSIMKDISRYTLHVEVVAELDGITYNYATSYNTRVTYTEQAVEFTAGDKRIHWNASQTKWFDDNGNEYTPDDTVIRYKISPSFGNLKSCTYEKLEEEQIPKSEGGSEP